MKRHSERDHSPRNKRSRNAHSPDLDYYDRHSVDYGRRDRHERRSPSPRRDSSRSYYDSGYHDRDSRVRERDYRSLCVSRLPPKLSDTQVRDELLKQFERYGDFNVKFAIFNSERVAYINFRYDIILSRLTFSIPIFCFSVF